MILLPLQYQEVEQLDNEKDSYMVRELEGISKYYRKHLDPQGIIINFEHKLEAKKLDGFTKAKIYNNLGVAYFYQAEFEKSLDYHKKA